MPKQIGNEPVFEDKEGQFKLAIFKNTNTKGVVYPLVCVTKCIFPFKFNQKIYFSPKEVPKLLELLQRIPEIEVEESKKNTKTIERLKIEQQKNENK